MPAHGVPTQAVYMMTIRGYVTDMAGRPVENVAVTDGVLTVQTDSSGRYAIDQEQLRDYLVTASKPGLEPSSRVVTPVDALNSVDFQLKYVLFPDATPRAFNNTPPKTLQVAIRSHAPIGSCVTWKDLVTGTELWLSLATPVPGGESTWAGTFDVPPGTPDGTFAYRGIARECGSGLALTREIQGSYIVDSIAPTVTELIPTDHGNTAFVSQPLLARISDGLSGVDPIEITFALVDETAGTSTTLSGTYHPLSRWARTQPLTMQEGHVYRFSVTAADLAGNPASATHSSASEGGGFLATRVELNPATATIPTTPCTVSSVNLSTGTRTATCPNVPLVIGPSSVALGGTRHSPATGFVEQTAPLNPAILRTTIAGVEMTQPAYPSGTTRAVSSPYFATTRGLGPFSLDVSGETRNLGTLTAEVPATWSDATLEMSSVQTTPSTSACADPGNITVQIYCVPDPVLSRFSVAFNNTVSDPAEVADQHAAQHGALLHVIYTPGYGRYTGWISLTGARTIALDSRVSSVSRDDTPDFVNKISMSADIGLRMDGSASVNSISGSSRFEDADGGLLQETAVPVSSEGVDNSGFACLPDSQPANMTIYEPATVTVDTSQVFVQFQYHPYLMREAWWVEDHFKLEFLICSSGGADAKERAETIVAGPGQHFKERAPGVPGEGAIDDFRIGANWLDKAQHPDSATLGFELSTGQVGVTGSLTQVIQDQLIGGYLGPYSVPAWDTFARNATNGWWAADCYSSEAKIADCMRPDTGSHWFQGSVANGLWWFDESDVPTTYWFGIRVYAFGHCQGCIDPIG